MLTKEREQKVRNRGKDIREEKESDISQGMKKTLRKINLSYGKIILYM